MILNNQNISKNLFVLCCVLVPIIIIFLRIPDEDSKIKLPLILINRDEEFLSLPHEKSFDHEKSIFFIEGFGKDTIPPRMICSVESAALAHRNTFIDVMMTSHRLQKSEGIKGLLKAYSNVRFLYLNATSIYMESPMKEWFLNETWKQSKHPEINFDDPLRFLLLFKYGGIYLDLDVIVLKNLKKEENFAGLESPSLVNSAAMGFSKSHPFLADCIKEMSVYFDKELWGVNGPQLITKILNRRCHAHLPDTDLKNCSDIKLYKKEVLYPIPWTNLDKFFEEDEEFTDTLLNHPDYLTFHFWNQLTGKREISLQGHSIYSVIARNLCPITSFIFDYKF